MAVPYIKPGPRGPAEGRCLAAGLSPILLRAPLGSPEAELREVRCKPGMRTPSPQEHRAQAGPRRYFPKAACALLLMLVVRIICQMHLTSCFVP